MLSYKYAAYGPGVKERIVEMAVNSSGVRDTARVLGISKGTVICTLKKSSALVRLNPQYATATGRPLAVRVEAAEMDEQWSFVGNKANQRWLWYAIDATTNTVLAFGEAGARTRFSRN